MQIMNFVEESPGSSDVQGRNGAIAEVQRPQFATSFSLTIQNAFPVMSGRETCWYPRRRGLLASLLRDLNFFFFFCENRSNVALSAESRSKETFRNRLSRPSTERMFASETAFSRVIVGADFSARLAFTSSRVSSASVGADVQDHKHRDRVHRGSR